MNEIEIEKLIIHHVDMSKRILTTRDTLCNIDEMDDLEYYTSKIESAWNNNKKKEVILGDFAPIKQNARNMNLSDEEFIVSSKIIANDFFHLNLMLSEIPTFDIVCIKASIKNEWFIFILKLHYQTAKLNVFVEEEGANEIYVLPKLKAPIDEAIIINEDQVFILEKKFQIDGKTDTYINNQYLKGELKLSDKEKLSLVYKIVKRINTIFNVTSFDSKAIVNSVLLDEIPYKHEINIHVLVSTIFEKDYNAREEAIDTLIDFGITEEDTIKTAYLDKNKLSKVKIIGYNMDVVVNIYDYLDEAGISISKNTIKINKEFLHLEVK